MPTFETARSALLWDATAVPNAFLCELMPSAPEGHVKVYLYGLMWARSGVAEEGDLLDEMARALQMDRTEVERAMRYWERCRLMERIQDLPPRYRFASVPMARLERDQLPRDEAYESFAQAMYAAFGDRRKLHGGETVLAYEWVEQYKLPPEVVLMLIQHMISTRGVNFSFKEAQKVAMELCEQRINTIEAAEAVFNRSEAAMRGARKILNHLGMRRSPSMDELDLYLKWTSDWGFDPKAIREACKETTSSHTPSFAYLDKVLDTIRQRTSGQATSETQVEKAIKSDNSEVALIRDVLKAMGISRTVIDDGLRNVYHTMLQKGPHDWIVLGAQQVGKRSNPSLDQLQLLLDSWSDQQLTSVETVSAHLAEVQELNAELFNLMKKAGVQSGRTLENRTRLKQWKNEWHMPYALIELAAELSQGKKEVGTYMHKLLTAWHDESIASVEEARAAHERATAAPQPAAASGKRVIEQQYQQRAYDPFEYDDIPEDQLEEMKNL